ncbi:MAG TPA: hypothetical protein VMS86_06545, partial [Thermoanaerobaculia bacterium]|nr:hypothetical protein [Thermoanaerobaculia bacterium]
MTLDPTAELIATEPGRREGSGRASLLRRFPHAVRRTAWATAPLAALLLIAPGVLAQASSPLVREVSLFRDGVGRVAWAAQGDWLAFDRPAAERGNYQLWIMKRDGTFERCLTCDPLELRRENC